MEDYNSSSMEKSKKPNNGEINITNHKNNEKNKNAKWNDNLVIKYVKFNGKFNLDRIA